MRFWLTLALCLLAGILSGCATSDPDADSDLPWNMPQSWEGSPMIPGLSE